MKKKKSTLLLLFVLIGLSHLCAQTKWSVSGEGIPGGMATLVQDTEDASLFKYVGKISNKSFKVSDGTSTYVALCGDNDPLGQTTDLRVGNAADAGLCIRYAGNKDYFRLSLKDNGSTPQLKVEEATAPEHVYIIGGYFNANNQGWLLDDALEVERDADNPYVFHYKGMLAYQDYGQVPGGVRFLVGLSWGGSVFPIGDADAPLSQSYKTATKMRTSGADTKWTIPADGSGNGYYHISIDLLEETIIVNSFEHVANVYPSKVFITGDVMSYGWTNENMEALLPVEGQYGVYSWTGAVKQGTFKFLRARKSWGMCYVATNANENIVFDQPHSFIYEKNYMIPGGGNDYKFVIPEAGICTIVLDFNTMTVTVKKNDPKFTDLWITGSAIPGGQAQLIPDRVNPTTKFRYLGELLSGEFKVMTSESAGAATEYFLPSTATDAISDKSTMYRTSNGTAGGWAVATPSNSYKLEFNVTGNEYKGFIHQVDNVYIVGGVVSVGWDSGKSIALEKDATDPNVFVFNGELKTATSGEDRNHFKFLLQQNWGPKSYHPLTDNEPLLSSEYISENRTGDYLWMIDESQQGMYTIKLNTLWETIEAKYSGNSSAPSLQLADTKVFTQEGTIHVKSESNHVQTVRVISLDGKELVRRSFVEETAIPLSSSVYLVEIFDNGTPVLRTKVAIVDGF